MWVCPYTATNFPGRKESNGFLSEDHFQIEAHGWAWKGFPELRRTWHHAANEGEKNVVKQNRDFSKGLVPGVYDFVFQCPSFVIELKQPGKWLNDNQVKYQAAMRRNNVPEYVCYFMEEFQAVVSEHFAKLGYTWREPERMIK